jgi:hypothetical protein
MIHPGKSDGNARRGAIARRLADARWGVQAKPGGALRIMARQALAAPAVVKIGRLL